MLGLDDVEIIWLGCRGQRLEDAADTLHEVVMKGVLDHVTVVLLHLGTNNLESDNLLTLMN